MSLYRTILRGTKRIGDPGTRSETRGFARAEFERHRGVTDLVYILVAAIGSMKRDTWELTSIQNHIRYLLSTGKTEWETMERYIEGM